MADLKPSTAPAASALDGTEKIPCTQGGASKALTPLQMKTYVGPVSSVLAANGTNSTDTMASTGLSVPVTLNRKYKFELEMHFSESVAAEGLAVDFGGGSAAATNFRASAILSDAGADTIASGNTTGALGDDIIAVTADDGILLVKGCFEPSSSGTFIPRYAQAAHAAGTLTILRGSSLVIWDIT